MGKQTVSRRRLDGMVLIRKNTTWNVHLHKLFFTDKARINYKPCVSFLYLYLLKILKKIRRYVTHCKEMQFFLK